MSLVTSDQLIYTEYINVMSAYKHYVIGTETNTLSAAVSTTGAESSFMFIHFTGIIDCAT